ncbi:hypothetical protein Dimus_039493 [Dionaea muscipula]
MDSFTTAPLPVIPSDVPPISALAVHTAPPAACLSISPETWIIDSGASGHMTGSLGMLSDFSPNSSYPDVRVANGSYVSVRGMGHVTLSPTLTLSSVLYLPSLPFNLLSVSALIRTHRCNVVFSGDVCVFQDPLTRTIIGRGRRVSGGLYVLEGGVPALACSSISSTAFQLHCRHGHPTLSSLKRLWPEVQSVSELFCESCQLAKHHRVPYMSRVNQRASAPFELVHSDVWGPCPVESKLGFSYFVSFVDDYSRMTWLYLMTNHSELFFIFTAFHTEIQTQFSLPIRIFRSDNAREYFSSPFTSFLTSHGIIHESSCPDTPPQNGVAERKNRHLLEVTRALMFHMKVPKVFWSEAVMTATYLINRMPSSVLQGTIPYFVLFPDMFLHPLHPLPLRVFGCTCYVRNICPHLTKLDPKALHCIFLGYSHTKKGYRCYSPDLRRFCISADVVFDESQPFFSTFSLESSPPFSSMDDTLVYELVSRSPASSPPDLPPPLQVYTRGPHPVISWGSVDAPEPAPAGPVPSSLDSSPAASLPIGTSEPTLPSTTPVSLDSSPVLSPPSDLDVPIALRKGRRHCPKYPMSDHVFYVGVSSSLQAFISQLDSISIPRSLSEAIFSPGWR